MTATSVGRRNGTPKAGMVRGLSVGLLGPAALGLWVIYNALEDHFGLDSVAALLINLVIFLAVGVLAGFSTLVFVISYVIVNRRRTLPA